MSGKGNASGPLTGARKRERTKPPEPVSEEQWRKRVAEAFEFKLRKKPSNSEIDNAVDEALKISIMFSRKLAQTKSGLRPSEKRETLDSHITALDKAAETIRIELLGHDLPPIMMPGDSRPHRRDELSLNASIAWDDFLHDPSGKTKSVFDMARFAASGESPVHEDMAEHVRQTLKVLEAVKARYDFIRSTKKSDPLGVDYWMSSDKLKRLFVADLMDLFCNLRGEQIDDVPIGNAKSTFDADDGSPTNPNPLLNFMNVVVTPIKELNFSPTHWVPPGTLRDIAREVRQGNWWR